MDNSLDAWKRNREQKEVQKLFQKRKKGNTFFESNLSVILQKNTERYIAYFNSTYRSVYNISMNL